MLVYKGEKNICPQCVTESCQNTFCCVKVLCNMSMASGHTKCHKKMRASLFPGCEINILLSSVSAAVYGTDSKERITIEENSLEDDKEYLVCDNLKNGLIQQ